MYQWNRAMVVVAAFGAITGLGCCGHGRVGPTAEEPPKPTARASDQGPVAVAESGVQNLHRDGKILIAGEPTDAGLEAMRREGVRTVIDLRTEPDKMAAEAKTARRLGMKYVAIPMQSSQLTEEQAEALMAAINQHKTGQVLIHCGGGNRAAGAYGYYLGATGQCPIQEALERATKVGLKNPDLAADVRRRLATRPASTQPATTRPHP